MNIKKHRNELTAQEVRDNLDYNPLTGEMHWKKSPARRIKVGDKAGCINKTSGVHQIALLGSTYIVTRLIFMWMTGLDHRVMQGRCVQHIDNDPTNCRWLNLFCTVSHHNYERFMAHTTDDRVMKCVKALDNGSFAVKITGFPTARYDTIDEVKAHLERHYKSLRCSEYK